MIQRIYYTLLLITFSPVFCLSQTSTENYVKTVTMLDANGTNSMSSVQYYNGLGFPTVAVATVGSCGQTAYSLTTYDASGREECNYLPVAIGNSMIYRSPEEIIKASASANNDDKTAYSQNHYDALNRVTSVELPGKAWRIYDKRNRMEYSTNGKEEVLHYIANPNGTNSLVKPNEKKRNPYMHYPAGSLTKEIQKDADDKTVITFKDLMGNVILQRANDGKNNLDTYYVYDELGRLSYVLSPLYQKNGKKAITAYEYRYDNRGRIAKKFLPGAGYIQYNYDNADRVVAMQDEIMRKDSIYRFTIYDNLGRLVIQGRCSNYNHNTTFCENNTVVATFNEGNNGFMGTNYVIPSKFEASIKSKTILEIVNYYDGNQSKITGNIKEHFNDAALSYVDIDIQKGQLTGSVTLAGNGEYLAQVMEYDKKGNLIKSKSREIGGRIAINTNTYNFTNNVESSTTTIKVGQKEYTVNNVISYNKYNNMKSEDILTIVTGNDKDIETIKNQNIVAFNGKNKARSEISYGYDELGRLKVQDRSGGSQQCYSYDMRGQVTGIGSVNFEVYLSYSYNGNISNMEWIHNKMDNNFDLDLGLASPRRYDFVYDGANRLTNSVYSEYNVRSGDYTTAKDHYSEFVRYDYNGNIITLQRRGKMQNGSYGLIDNLALTYNGNQLSNVNEYAEEIYNSNSFDYKGDNGSKYVYNENGSLIADQSRDIAYIKYDYNNNPLKIYFVNGNETEYVYSASGQKLRVKHITALPNVMTRTVGEKPTSDLPSYYTFCSITTDYLLGGNLIVKEDHPYRYVFDEGYCTISQQINPITDEHWNDLSFYYYDKDHLGNIREIIGADGELKQILQYYPFGTTYADASAVMNADLQQHKYNGKELDKVHGLNTYDYGARQYNPITARWDRMDPHCEKYYNVSPYVYCVNNPIHVIDPDGKDIYMLFYVTGNGKQQDDAMFKASAETRKRDIEESKGFNKESDIVILMGIQDLGKLGDMVSGIINEYSEQYGKTAEFGIWSHNGWYDGPIGSVETSSDAFERTQMTVDGWSKIKFNWSDNASAGFYGCNSGRKHNDRASFTTILSGKQNFRNVDIYGQTNFSYPSTSSTSRKTSTGMLRGEFSVPTYMVGCDKNQGKMSYLWGTSISPMRKSRNGRGVIVK